MERYCEYILDKRGDNKMVISNPIGYRTKEELLGKYNSSSCYSQSAHLSNRLLVDCLQEAIDQIYGRYKERFDSDCCIVIEKCITKISKLHNKDIVCESELDMLFDIIINYLWIELSVFVLDKPYDRIHLIVDYSRRHLLHEKYFDNMIKKIHEEECELSAMKAAESLPVYKKIFTGLVRDDDVKYFANSTHLDRKYLISTSKNDIIKNEMLLYGCLVSNSYYDYLKKRYF